MENKMFCGIKEIDEKIVDFSDDDIFLVKSSLNRPATLLALHFAFSCIKSGGKTIYVSSHGLHGIKYYADFIGLNLDDAVLNEKLILLNYPLDMHAYISDRDNYDLVLNDLKVYIDDSKADRIVFDTIEPLIVNEGHLSKILFNRLLYFINNLSLKVLVTFEDLKSEHIISLNNIANCIFSLTGSKNSIFDKNTTFILDYRRTKSDVFNFHLNLSTEHNKGLVYQSPKSKEEFVYSQIATIHYPAHHENLGNRLKAFSPNSIKVLSYSSQKQLQNNIGLNSNELVLIDEYVDGKSGYQKAIEIRDKRKNINLGLITTAAISPNKRILANNAGFNSFLFFPFTENHVEKLFSYYIQRESMTNRKKMKVYINSLFKNLDRDDTYMDFNDFGIRLKNYSLKISDQQNNYCLVRLEYDTILDEILTNETIKVVRPDFFAKYFSLNRTTIIMIKEKVKAYENFKNKLNKTVFRERTDEDLININQATSSRFSFPSEYFTESFANGQNDSSKLATSKLDFYYFPFSVINVKSIIEDLSKNV